MFSYTGQQIDVVDATTRRWSRVVTPGKAAVQEISNSAKRGTGFRPPPERRTRNSPSSWTGCTTHVHRA